MSLGSVKVSDLERVITGLSSDIKPITANAKNKFLETDTGDIYEYSGSSWNLLVVNSVDGAQANLVVVTQQSSVQQNRNIATVAQVHPGTDATNVATWTTGEDIHKIVIPPGIRYTTNATSAAAEKTTLDAAGGIATTINYGRTYSDSLVYSQESAITRLGMRSMSGADQTEVTIEASV